MNTIVKTGLVVGGVVAAGALALKSQYVNNLIGWVLTHPTNKKDNNKKEAGK